MGEAQDDGTLRGCRFQIGLIDGEKRRKLVLHVQGAVECEGGNGAEQEECKNSRDPVNTVFHKKYFNTRKSENKAIIENKAERKGQCDNSKVATTFFRVLVEYYLTKKEEMVCRTTSFSAT
jgi:hypothetical protein